MSVPLLTVIITRGLNKLSYLLSISTCHYRITVISSSINFLFLSSIASAACFSSVHTYRLGGRCPASFIFSTAIPIDSN